MINIYSIIVSIVKIKRGRPVGKGKIVRRFKPTTMVMDDFKFNPELFVPMKTNKKIILQSLKTCNAEIYKRR